MNGPWTLPELTAQAGSALSAALPSRPHGRSRDLPNERMIRWYVTIGLVDPPSSRRGRVALYGSRHLLQLVAIKRRQAEGHSLAEIQAELTGATDATLQKIAAPGPDEHGRATAAGGTRTPGDATRASARATGPSSAAGEDEGHRRRLWAERPGPCAATEPGSGHAVAESRAAASAEVTAGDGSSLVHGVRLAGGVTLLVGTPLTSDDVDAITAVTGPLLDVLAERGLR